MNFNSRLYIRGVLPVRKGSLVIAILSQYKESKQAMPLSFESDSALPVGTTRRCPSMIHASNQKKHKGLDALFEEDYPGETVWTEAKKIMPKQECYLELKRGEYAVRVLKTYDGSFAREAFDAMDERALDTLASTLFLKENYELADIPPPESYEYRDFLWDALVDGASESGHLRSYFIVETEGGTRHQEAVYVSADWPSAEGFAKSAMAATEVIA